jgi:hypothetical protein
MRSCAIQTASNPLQKQYFNGSYYYLQLNTFRLKTLTEPVVYLALSAVLVVLSVPALVDETAAPLPLALLGLVLTFLNSVISAATVVIVKNCVMLNTNKFQPAFNVYKGLMVSIETSTNKIIDTPVRINIFTSCRKQSLVRVKVSTMAFPYLEVSLTRCGYLLFFETMFSLREFLMIWCTRMEPIITKYNPTMSAIITINTSNAHTAPRKKMLDKIFTAKRTWYEVSVSWINVNGES